jgi:hypothetical protein
MWDKNLPFISGKLKSKHLEIFSRQIYGVREVSLYFSKLYRMQTHQPQCVRTNYSRSIRKKLYFWGGGYLIASIKVK